MKYLIIFVISLTIFVSCFDKKVKKHDGKPVRVVAIFHNPYKGGFSLDSIYRVIKDTVKLNDDDKVIKTSDTTYYISLLTTYPDPKDSTHKLLLKGKDGKDSTQLLFYPIPPKEIIHPRDLE